MARRVNCVLLKREADGLDYVPYPGELGKRIYNDKLNLLEESADGRRRYEIYGWKPGYEEIEGTDLYAVARGRISVTPIHFDLTDHGGLDRLRAIDFEAMLASNV